MVVEIRKLLGGKNVEKRERFSSASRLGQKIGIQDLTFTKQPPLNY